MEEIQSLCTPEGLTHTHPHARTHVHTHTHTRYSEYLRVVFKEYSSVLCCPGQQRVGSRIRAALINPSYQHTEQMRERIRKRERGAGGKQIWISDQQTDSKSVLSLFIIQSVTFLSLSTAKLQLP